MQPVCFGPKVELAAWPVLRRMRAFLGPVPRSQPSFFQTAASSGAHLVDPLFIFSFSTAVPLSERRIP